MVCLGNICINTLDRGDNAAADDDDNDNNNNNNNNKLNCKSYLHYQYLRKKERNRI
jgi:hypothetical protein